MRGAIPLVVVGGFLGAGKTTLLNRWLAGADGERIAVLVNDFGAINIDAALIAASTGETIALTNGCVCCQIGGDLVAALISLLAASPPFDAVLVEASGVSDPWRIAQIARAEPDLELAGVLVLVDASAVLEQSRDPLLGDTLAGQLRSADLVVLNKLDLADAAQRAGARDWLATHGAGARVLETDHADVPRDAVLGLHAARSVEAAFAGHALARVSHGDRFETWSLPLGGEFAPAALRELLAQLPEGVVRLKGILRRAGGGWQLVQYAARRGSLREVAAPADGVAAVVAIGLAGRLPRAELEAAFARLAGRDDARP